MNVLVDWDEFKGLVQVEVLELGARIGEVFSFIHAVVLLILIAVQIGDCPVGLVLGKLFRLILIMLDKLLSDILPLNVFFQFGQLVTEIESFKVFAELVINFIMLCFLEHWDNGAIHNLLLHRLRKHVLLIVFEVDGVKEL